MASRCDPDGLLKERYRFHARTNPMATLRRNTTWTAATSRIENHSVRSCQREEEASVSDKGDRFCNRLLIHKASPSAAANPTKVIST